MNERDDSRARHVAALHIAALPFPSHQGTQAALRFMLEALVEGGSSPELLTYAHGAREPLGFPHHRARALVRDRSLRSGPSVSKVLNDVGLALSARRLSQRFPLVVAHHVEAAAVARFTSRPVLFVAHTSLGPELPTYFSPRWARSTAHLGRAIDRVSMTGARAVAAVSPLLRDELASLGHREVHLLPLPWPVPPPITPTERRASRAALGLGPQDAVVLYAGNLDAYQGFALLLEALDGIDAKLLLASEDSPARVPGLTERIAAGKASAISLLGEEARRLAHAAADVVALPRRSPGGLPVKLLDALARGLVVAATPRALAGYDGLPVVTAQRDDASALAQAISTGLALSPEERRALGEAGRAHVARAHSGAAFRARFSEAARGALTR